MLVWELRLAEFELCWFVRPLLLSPEYKGTSLSHVLHTILLELDYSITIFNHREVILTLIHHMEPHAVI